MPPGAALRSLQGPFLRRDDELRILQENLDAVRAGGVRAVCLTGEPGAGKTTLLEHFVSGIQTAPGQLVTFSTCSQRLAGAEAFLPLLDGLDGLTRAGEDAAITRLLRAIAPTWYVQIAPLWSTADPAFASVLERARAASPERVKRELAAFVAHITAVRPLVVAIDDLHWADASTVEVLAYLLSKPDLERLLLVCAYRQTEMTLSAHPFVSVRHELMKRRILVEVPLRRFSRQETACYLDLVFPENRFPKELAEVVQARSNGNPLFVSEIARDLMERGAVRRREGRWCIEASLDQVRSSLPCVHSERHRTQTRAARRRGQAPDDDGVASGHGVRLPARGDRSRMPSVRRRATPGATGSRFTRSSRPSAKAIPEMPFPASAMPSSTCCIRKPSRRQ